VCAISDVRTADAVDCVTLGASMACELDANQTMRMRQRNVASAALRTTDDRVSDNGVPGSRSEKTPLDPAQGSPQSRD